MTFVSERCSPTPRITNTTSGENVNASEARGENVNAAEARGENVNAGGKTKHIEIHSFLIRFPMTIHTVYIFPERTLVQGSQ